MMAEVEFAQYLIRSYEDEVGAGRTSIESRHAMRNPINVKNSNA